MPSNEIATREQPGALATPGYNLDDMNVMADSIARSGLFPGIKNPQQAFCLMMLCQAKGLHPMTAVERFHIIDGDGGPRHSMTSAAIQAEFQSHGGEIRIVRLDEEEARAMFRHPKLHPDWYEAFVTYEQFERTGMTQGKFGVKKNWKCSRPDMLWARLVTKTIRKIYPGIVLGIYSPEEIEDMEALESPTVFPASTSLPPPATVREVDPYVLGYTGTGLDERPYHLIVAEALNAANRETAKLWAAEPDDVPRPLPLQAPDLHRHLMNEAIQLGHVEGPPPSKLSQAIKDLAGLYKSRRDWVRAEIQSWLEARIKGPDSGDLIDVEFDETPEREPGEDG